ncbi:MAG: sulfatase activating formylglycine-generating enzyme, partial [Planctomycetaceae bacterium]
GVSWYEAMAFCKCAGGELPTEAQWEYACRAGTKTKYSFGNDVTMLAEYAWYGSNSEKQTHPVGLKKPNPWGLHDMHGNVDEWCFDGGRIYELASVIDSVGPTEMSVDRVIRGGSWGDSARSVRAASRHAISVGDRHDSIGFRCRIQCPPTGPEDGQAERRVKADASRAGATEPTCHVASSPDCEFP